MYLKYPLNPDLHIRGLLGQHWICKTISFLTEKKNEENRPGFIASSHAFILKKELLFEILILTFVFYVEKEFSRMTFDVPMQWVLQELPDFSRYCTPTIF